MTMIDPTINTIELQGLVDLAQLMMGFHIAEDHGLIVDGKPDADACLRLLRLGKQRGVTPRNPIVNPLELITNLLHRDIGVIEPNVDVIGLSLNARRIGPEDQSVPYYAYKMYVGDDFVGDVKVCKEGIEIHFQGTVWRVSVNEMFGLFAKAYGG